MNKTQLNRLFRKLDNSGLELEEKERIIYIVKHMEDSNYLHFRC